MRVSRPCRQGRVWYPPLLLVQAYAPSASGCLHCPPAVAAQLLLSCTCTARRPYLFGSHGWADGYFPSTSVSSNLTRFFYALNIEVGEAASSGGGVAGLLLSFGFLVLSNSTVTCVSAGFGARRPPSCTGLPNQHTPRQRRQFSIQHLPSDHPTELQELEAWGG